MAQVANTDPTPLRKLYDRIAESGTFNNLPEYETFSTALNSNPDARRKFYDRLVNETEINPPEYETFQKTLFSNALNNKAEQDNTSKSLSSESPQTGDLEASNTTPLPKNEGKSPFLNIGKTLGFDGESESENRRDAGQILGTFWNVGTKQIPAMMESFKAATFDKTTPIMHRGVPVDPALSEEENIAERQKAMRGAIDRMGEFQESQKGKVTQVSQIGDGIDLLNYIGNSVAQGAAQIPASILSAGATSIGQEVGIIYMDQVEKIAEREGITPEEVIEKGLDDPASALAYGTAAGLLDYAGAKGATKMLPYGEFKKSLGQRAIGAFQAFKREALTEGTQSGIEQFGAGRGAGDSMIEALSGVNPNEMAEEGVAGGIGGTGVNVGMQVASNFVEKAKKSEGGLPEGFILKQPDSEGQSETVDLSGLNEQTQETQEESVQETEAFTEREQEQEVNEEIETEADPRPTPPDQEFQEEQVEDTIEPIPPGEKINKEPWEMTFEEFEMVRPPVKDYLYHGSPEGNINELDPYIHTQRWREGQGVYATDDREFAAEYARGRTAKGDRRSQAGQKGRVNYIKSEAENVIDMDADMDQDLWNKMADDFEVDREVLEGKNYQALNDIREAIAEEYGSESWYMVEEWLREQGYDATTHVEGKKRGRPHQVTIFKGDAGLDAEGNEFNSLKGKVIPPKQVHKEQVEQALKEGKQVPEEVLREYPELQASPDNPLPAKVDERYESWIDVSESTGMPTIKVRNKEKGQEIDYKSNNRKGVIVDFIRQGAPGLRDAESQINQELEQMPEQEAQEVFQESFDASGNPNPETILERSQNPAEIANAIDQAQQNYQSKIGGDLEITLTESYWDSGTALPVSDIKQFGDFNKVEGGTKKIIKSKETKASEKGLSSAEGIASELSGLMDREVTPEEVVDSYVSFWDENYGSRKIKQFNDPLSNELAEKFYQITGQNYTPEFGEQLNTAWEEYKIEQEGANPSALESETSDFIDQEGNINYNELLNSESAAAEYVGNNSPLTQEEVAYVTRQIQEYEQREQGVQREDEQASPEAEVREEETTGVPQQQEQQQQEEVTPPTREVTSKSEYAEETADLKPQLTSPDLGQATPSATIAAQAAIDAGVTSQPEFWQWTKEAIGAEPNGEAMALAWESVTGDPVNVNKLAINRKEGSAWTKFKNKLDDMRYSITKNLFVYNQRARDAENWLEEVFGREYFSDENSKYLMSWAMDSITGKAGNMIGKFIDPNKPYSVLRKITKEIAARDNINTVNFNEIDNLYRKLAKANREQNTGKANEIKQQIQDFVKQDDLQQYLLAKHAIESNEYAQTVKNPEKIEDVQAQIEALKQERKQSSDFKERRTIDNEIKDLEDYLNTLRHPLGMSTEQANDVLSSFQEQGKTQDLEAIAQMIWQLDDVILTMAVENGIVSKQDAENMRNVYQHHIPAQRKLTDENGNLVGDILPDKPRGKEEPRIQERKGSNRIIGHVLTNIVSNFEDMVTYAHSNKAKADIAASIERETSKGNMMFGRVVDLTEAGDFDTITEFRRPETETYYDEEGNQQEHEVIKEKAIIWADPELGKAVNKTEMTSVNGLPNWAIQAARLLLNFERAVLTSMSPSFLLSNPVRDLNDAAFNVSNRESFTSGFKLMKNAALPEFQGKDGSKAAWNERILAAHRAIVQYEKGNHDLNEMTRLFGELKSEGGTSTFFQFRNHKDIMNSLEKTMQDMRNLEKKGPLSPAKWKSLIKKKLEALERLNESMENATRLAVYKTVLEAGKSKAEAARLAKEATVNFDMKGNYSPWLKLGYLFLQVALNSVTSMGKGIKQNPKRAIATVTGLIAAGMGVAALRDAMGDDEDEYYKDKQTNLWKYNTGLVFKIPGTDYDPKIPMGYQVSTFTSFGGHLYDYMKGYSTGEQFTKRAASAAVDVYNPFGGSEIFSDTKYFWRSVSPTAFKPFVEVGVNRSFFGPIYNPYMEASPQYGDWQLRSQGDRRISTYLSNWLIKNDIADMSPKTFDHFIDFVGGGLLRDVEGGSNEIARLFQAATNDMKNPDGSDYELKVDELPIIRRFLDEVDPTRLSYNNIWFTITNYDNPKPINSKEFTNQLNGLEKDYRRVANSGMFPESMLTTIENSFQNYVDTNFKKAQVQEAIKYLRENNLTGEENRSKRRGYYRSQNILSEENGIPYYKWEDGQFIFTLSERKRFTNNMIEKIEARVGNPGVSNE